MHSSAPSSTSTWVTNCLWAANASRYVINHSAFYPTYDDKMSLAE